MKDYIRSLKKRSFYFFKQEIKQDLSKMTELLRRYDIIIVEMITMYKSPFTITNQMLSLCISITEKVGQINNYQSLKRMPILRKNNKIKSIHSSLAIEANSLSLNQVKDVIEGKVVIGPIKEIQEVKNGCLKRPYK